MKYVNVVIDNKNDNTDRFYTYLCADDGIEVGRKVYVPFARGDKMKEAYVVQVFDRLVQPIKGIKAVDHTDEEVVLSKEAIETCFWMKERYLCRYIDCIKCFTPSGASSKRGKRQNPYENAVGEIQDIEALTQEQEDAIQTIYGDLEDKKNTVFLIHGITNSGKTEIYMRTIAKVIEQGKQAIMLVPEITLTPQTIARFIGRFGAQKVAVLHSKLSLGQRYDEWMRVKNGEVSILIGARSGVFAPFPNIGVIILDEEHETSYKSDKTPKYDTVEVAVKRAELSGAITLLGSATPSLVSYYKGQRGDYKLITLKERYNKTPLPNVAIVDMREELKNGNKTIFSKALYRQIKENLEAKKQVILFLNRRGYSTFVSCRNCGYAMKCKHCGVALTYHKASEQAICHICGFREIIPKSCPKCGSKHIKYFGTGTEKVEEITRKFFPDSAIARLDLDTVKQKGSIERILNGFKKGKTQILIGTQLVAKGLDFSRVGLVGIVAADLTLNLPDFRAAERAFQLITQAAGRAGRGEELGNVVIQTYTPDHYAIVTAGNHDYEEFYRCEMEIRKALNYPPFCEFLEVIISSKEVKGAKVKSQEFIEHFKRMAAEDVGQFVFGPWELYANNVNDQDRQQIIIKVMEGHHQEVFSIVNELKLKITKDRKSNCFISIGIN
ncbi:MAG: primosomal protein N' [Anaerovorax sp.]